MSIDRTRAAAKAQSPTEKYSLSWCGYSTLVVETSNDQIVFDPVGQVEGDAGLICISHEHDDHFQIEEVRRLSRSGAMVFAPPSIAKRVARYSSNVVEAEIGTSVQFGRVTITATRCDHSGVDPVCFVLDFPKGQRVYVPHDTHAFPTMEGIMQGAIESIMFWAGSSLKKCREMARIVDPMRLIVPAYGGRDFAQYAAAELLEFADRLTVIERAQWVVI